MIREVTGELLTSFGYRVLAAGTPAQALDLAALQENPIDLLATDVIMPQMSGPNLYDRLLETHPALPVLYISGYTNSLEPDDGEALQDAVFLAKPFTLEQFMAKVGLMFCSGAHLGTEAAPAGALP